MKDIATLAVGGQGHGLRRSEPRWQRGGCARHGARHCARARGCSCLQRSGMPTQRTRLAAPASRLCVAGRRCRGRLGTLTSPENQVQNLMSADSEPSMAPTGGLPVPPGDFQVPRRRTGIWICSGTRPVRRRQGPCLSVLLVWPWSWPGSYRPGAGCAAAVHRVQVPRRSTHSGWQANPRDRGTEGTTSISIVRVRFHRARMR